MHVQFAYDALDRRIETVFNASGNIVSQTRFSYVYDATGEAFELQLAGDNDGNIVRRNLRGPGQAGLLAVDQAVDNDITRTVWTFADSAGTVHTTAFVDSSENWRQYQLRFDSNGDLIPLGGGDSDAALTSVPVVWRGLRKDPFSDLYLAGLTVYDPQNGRYLTQAARDTNPYRFNGNRPNSPDPATTTVATTDYLAGVYSSGLQRLLGEGFRSVLGDAYLAQATDAELRTIVYGSSIAGGVAALFAPEILGLSGLSAAVVGGAAGGLAEYSTIIGTASIFDETDTVRYLAGDAAAFTIGGAIGGGVGGGVGYGVGIAAGQIGSAAIRRLPLGAQQAINDILFVGGADIASTSGLRNIANRLRVIQNIRALRPGTATSGFAEFSRRIAPRSIAFEIQIAIRNSLDQGELLTFRTIDPEARIGLTGSAVTGRVGNPNKVTYGQPINPNDFDVDLFIQSDILYEQFGGGLRAAPNLRNALVKQYPEIFVGLRPGKKGLSIKFREASAVLPDGSIIF